MKRSMADDPPTSDEIQSNLKKVRFEDEEKEKEKIISENNEGFALLDEDLLYEVFKHADARSLAVASCVNRTWHRTAQDERLWELICTRHWPNSNCGTDRLRSVVLALGGFRRLHALYLCKADVGAAPVPPIAAVAPVPQSPIPMVPARKVGNKRWGKDEVHLSLSLLSIRYYEKMNYTIRNKNTN